MLRTIANGHAFSRILLKHRGGESTSHNMSAPAKRLREKSTPVEPKGGQASRKSALRPPGTKEQNEKEKKKENARKASVSKAVTSVLEKEKARKALDLSVQRKMSVNEKLKAEADQKRKEESRKAAAAKKRVASEEAK